MTSHRSTPLTADVIVAGAGAVGLALAVALARDGFSVVSLGSASASRNGRTVALLDGSVRMLRALQVWPRLEGLAAPLAVMRLVDDTGSLFRVPPVNFKASEIGLPAFGYNIENADLVESLMRVANDTVGLVRVDALLRDFHQTEGGIVVRTDGGAEIAARLLIAADGASSPTRIMAGIATRTTDYPQVALTTVLHHAAPHGNVSTEFHTREGPFTLVPLPANDEARHRSSLVWVMTPAKASERQSLAPLAFAQAIESQSRLLLGRVKPQGIVGRFPIRSTVADRLVGTRLALAGEAAHALPPIGAQGLNLSFRDAATLVDHLAKARQAGLDHGSATVLAGYERARMGDIAVRSRGVDMLNSALLSRLLPVDLLRGAGLLALASIPAARQAVMREGLRPQHAVPSLMR
ncbi:FAD-dependent monooxygenase [Lichenihabitans sp. PAMC28606]|uniref:FAD-dependent monooxygenase n=1 Tax=Lichenihabitans sp. PAMC28606 TaxID=2880932 RepID=UPI001D0A26F4|nr:FAD-dependent monooxygenase [Lichenihabitans sp. PAMC28606]UDL95456.1 FAD-dependent monooxygenase [Lichenihabitans sp. PAMC28606]